MTNLLPPHKQWKRKNKIKIKIKNLHLEAILTWVSEKGEPIGAARPRYRITLNRRTFRTDLNGHVTSSKWSLGFRVLVPLLVSRKSHSVLLDADDWSCWFEVFGPSGLPNNCLHELLTSMLLTKGRFAISFVLFFQSSKVALVTPDNISLPLEDSSKEPLWSRSLEKKEQEEYWKKGEKSVRRLGAGLLGCWEYFGMLSIYCDIPLFFLLHGISFTIVEN